MPDIANTTNFKICPLSPRASIEVVMIKQVAAPEAHENYHMIIR